MLSNQINYPSIEANAGGNLSWGYKSKFTKHTYLFKMHGKFRDK